MVLLLFVIILLLEVGLLLVVVNIGFFVGLVVFVNMVIDKWMLYFFSLFFSCLVMKNGIMLMGVFLFIVLLFIVGDVSVLVVLYSINVFLIFLLLLLGFLCYWIVYCYDSKGWLFKFISFGFGFVVCGSILVIMMVEKFFVGGWLILLIISGVIVLGWWMCKFYGKV